MSSRLPPNAEFPESRGQNAAASHSSAKSKISLTLRMAAEKIRSKIRGFVFTVFAALDSNPDK
jgi:hypothetical protein